MKLNMGVRGRHKRGHRGRDRGRNKGRMKGRKNGRCPYNNYVDGECLTPLEIGDLARQALFVDFDAEAAAALLDPNYIQHNPLVPTGPGPLLGSIAAFKESGVSVEVHRSLEDGCLVAYHETFYNATLFGGETLVAFDILRIEDGVIKEHWDNYQELTGPSPSGNTMTDGPTMVEDKRKTEKNRRLGTDFMDTVVIGGDISVVTDFVSEDMYIQHNPLVADGLDATLEGLAEFGVVYNSVEIVITDGNFFLTASDGLFGGVPTAYYDLNRIQDGLIVEHWGVQQTIPPPEQFAHDNGKF